MISFHLVKSYLKFSLSQVEGVDQIDKLQPGSQNIVKYFSVANVMQMSHGKVHLSDRPKNSLFAT